MKVYCKNCRFLSTFMDMLAPECGYPKNIKEKQLDTWYSDFVYKEYIRDPRVINENNDCQWFEQKEN